MQRTDWSKMKKFMKFCAIITAIMLVVGFGIALGITLTHNHGKMNAQISDMFGGIDSGAIYDIEDELVFHADYPVDSGDVEYSFGSGITKAEIGVGGCIFRMEESTDDQFHVTGENTGKIQVYQEGDKLYICSVRSVDVWKEIEKCKITLSIPAGTVFEKAEFHMGAGAMELGNLNAHTIELEVGAGQIKAENLTADNAEWKVGAGEITVENMDVKKLTASVGAGNIYGKGNIVEAVDAVCAMGNMEFVLKGQEDDFNYRMKCMAGNIMLKGKTHSGAVMSQDIDNGSSRNIDLECTMGNVEIDFYQE